MRKIYRFFLSRPLWLVYIILLCSLIVLPSSMGNLLSEYFSLESDWKVQDITLSFKEIVSVLIITPLLETAIYQCFIFLFLKYLFNLRTFLIISISSVIFGLAHYYNIVYILSAIISGIILIFTYIIFDKRKLHPFWMTTSLHFLINLLALTAYIK